MKTYSTKDIRNVVLLGSSKSGKTTLAEAMLFEGKVINRRGTVEDMNTVSDHTEIEHENQRSIYATPLYAEFKDKKFNIVDTPGADDFIGGAIAAFKVCESGILVINAQHGVEVSTEIFARYAEKFNLPLIIAVNQLDTDKADWDAATRSIKDAFGPKPILIQFPTGTGQQFDGLIDVLKMKYYHFKDENGTREELDIPAEFRDKAEMLRETLIEKAAEASEDLMIKFFDAGKLSEDEIREGLNIGINKGDVMPVFCISAKKDMGVKRLMEFGISTLSSPENRTYKTKDGKDIACKTDDPTSIFIYKTDVEPHLGDISFFKVISGKLTEGKDLEDSRGNKERISAIYTVAGTNKEKVGELVAGDLGCTVKLRAGKTNLTLCEPGANIDIEDIVFPSAKYRTAVKPVSQNDDSKLGDALNKISSQDPTLIVEYSKELKQIILSGQGEQHINIVRQRIEKEFGIEVELMAPKIPYRETITKTASSMYRHKKQSGGAGQFGEVHMIICPGGSSTPKIGGKELPIRDEQSFDLEWGGKLNFYNCVVGGAIDNRFMPAILKGINDKITEGPLTGSYARDINVYIHDGKMHPVDSNEISFVIAARKAFKEAFRNAGPKIMEPIYNIKIITPNEYVGPCMSDLNTRRGMIMDQTMEKGFAILKARIPLAELYKYSTTLSSITAGAATFTMEFSDYQPVPGDVQKELLEAYAAAEAENED